MAKPKKSEETQAKPRKRPATSPEARENQLISMAYDVAEQQLRDGTISAAVLAELIKAGSKKRQAELEKLQKDTELNEAKAAALASAKRVEELYSEAMAAFRTYSGLGADDHTD
jgi:hypothetical protein